MDPITHGLSGAIWAKAGFSQKYGKIAKWLLVVSAMLPDIDWVFIVAGEFTFLKQHRGFTHSIPGGFILALLLSFIFYRFTSLKKYWLILKISIIGIYTHIFLDLITSYGTQIFWPFTDRRYSLDTVFIIDLTLTGILLIPLILGNIIKEKARLYAKTSLMVLACYLILTAISHSIALKRVIDYTRTKNLESLKLSAFPQPLSPFRWMGIIESPDSFYQFRFHILDGGILKDASYKKDITNEYIKKADELEVVKLFRWFAEYPLATTYREENGNFIVEYFDLRFGTFDNRHPFLLTISLNANGEIKDIKFH